ncbi:MAG: hypothetical protein RL095_913, partial [Verrucomicrobiota bacterium]
MIDRNHDERPQIENLEERILMSASPVQDEAYVAVAVQTEPAAEQQPAQVVTEIVIVDSGVKDPAAFLATIPATAEVHVLNTDSSGVDQISAILAGKTGITALHIVSHGSNGQLQLGNGSLNASNVAETAAWKNALSNDADILLYGCDVAQDAQGSAFVAALANTTGADVAASDDKSGSVALGGDSDLEVAYGKIEAKALILEKIKGLLADIASVDVINPSANMPTKADQLDVRLNASFDTSNIGDDDYLSVMVYLERSVDGQWTAVDGARLEYWNNDAGTIAAIAAAAPSATRITYASGQSDANSLWNYEFTAANLDPDEAGTYRVRAEFVYGDDNGNNGPDTGDTVEAMISVSTSFYVANLATNDNNSTLTLQSSGTAGAPAVGDVLFAGLNFDDDNFAAPTGSYTYNVKWQVSATGAAGSWADVAGAVTNTFTLAPEHAGLFVRAVATYTDEDGFENTSVSAATAAAVAASSTSNNNTSSVTVTNAGVAVGNIDVGDILTASFTIADTNNAITNYNANVSLQWQVSTNGTSWADILGATTSTYTVTSDMLGNQIRALISYTDDEGFLNVAASAASNDVTAATGNTAVTGTLQILNSANVVIDTSNGAATPPAQVGDVLSASVTNLTDPNGLPLEINYQWQVSVSGDVNDEAGWVNIIGATGIEYTVDIAQLGKFLRYVISFTDNAGYSEVLKSAPTEDAVIAANNLTSGLPIITGDAIEGQTLSVDLSQISDADGMTSPAFTYQWQHFDDVTGWTNIAGAIASTYPIANPSLFVGERLRVIVGYTDDLLTVESVTSAATPAVSAFVTPGGSMTPGGNGTATSFTVNGTPQVGQILTASVTGLADPEGLPPSVNYSWQVSASGTSGWTTIEGASGVQYTLTAAEEGLFVRALITYVDNAGNNEAIGSTPSPQIGPAAAASVSGLITGILLADYPIPPLTADPSIQDGLLTDYWWQYTVDGGLTWNSIQTSDIDLTLIGDYVGGQIRVYDVTNGIVLAGPVGPVGEYNNTVVGYTGIPATGNVLTAFLSGPYLDSALNSLNDTNTVNLDTDVSYTWQRSFDGGTTWVNVGFSRSYSVTAADAGSVLRFLASYTDDFGVAENAAHFPIQIGAINAGPEGVVRLVGDVRLDNSTTPLTADFSGVTDANGINTDPDGNPATPAYTYLWEYSIDNGASWAQIGGTTSTTTTILNPSTDLLDSGSALLTAGALVRVSVTYVDMHPNANVATVTSQARYVYATTPITAASSSPNAPTYVSFVVDTSTQSPSVLTANLTGLSDADGLPGPDGFSYQWQISSDNGTTWSAIVGATSTTYTVPAADQTKVFRVSVSYVDGSGHNETFNSLPNHIVENRPLITQAATVLTSDITGLVDDDGKVVNILTTLAYQWQYSSDGVTWTNLVTNAVAAAYDLTDAALELGSIDGKSFRVVVSFDDDLGNSETVASLGFSNTVRTGSVVIDNFPGVDATFVGATIDANTTGLADVNGLGAFTYQWQNSSDGVTWTDIVGATASTYDLQLSDLRKYVRVAVSFIDAAGFTETATYATSLPQLNPSQTLIPGTIGSPTVGNTLLAYVTGSFQDTSGNIYPSIDTVNLDTEVSYTWQRSFDNGISWINVAYTRSYTLTAADAGADIQFVATLVNDYGVTETVTMFPLQVGAPNVGPVGLPRISDTVRTDIASTLSVDYSAVYDANGINTLEPFTYSWQVSADNGATWTPVSATATIDPNALGLTAGNLLRVVFSYTDLLAPTANVETVTSQSVYIYGAAPIVADSTSPSAPTYVSFVVDTSTKSPTVLTANLTGLSDADGLPPVDTFSYQWQVNDGSGWTTITGATASTYTVPEADHAKTFRVAVSYTDLGGHLESFTSVPNHLVQNRPVITVGGVIAGQITGPAGTTLTADTDGVVVTMTTEEKLALADADGLGAFSYQWQRSLDGVTWMDIGGATLLTYDTVAEDAGHYLRVVVSYTDLLGNAEVVASLATDRYNIAAAGTPIIQTVKDNGAGGTTIAAAVTADLVAGTILTTDPSVITDDNGVTNAVFAYTWQTSFDGLVWTTVGTERTYTLASTDAHKFVRVTVSLTDDDGFAESRSSAPTDQQVNGQLVGTPLVVGSAVQGEVLTADLSGITDINGLPYTLTFGVAGAGVTFLWQSSNDGITWGTAAGGTTNAQTYTVDAGDSSQHLRVLVTFTDVDGHAESIVSARTVLVDGDVTAGTVVVGLGLGSAGYQVGAQLEADVTAAFVDPNGVPAIDTYTYQWQYSTDAGASWTSISGATARTYIVSSDMADKTIRVLTSFVDLDGYTETIASGATVAINAPSTGSTFIGGSAVEGQTLEADVTTIVDVNDSTLTFSYDWQYSVDGVNWVTTGVTTKTYALTAADGHRYMRVVVTAADSVTSTTTSFTSASTVRVNDINSATVAVAYANASSEMTAGQTVEADVSAITAAQDANGVPAANNFAYQWQASNDGGNTWVSISGANASRYTLATSDAGKTIRVIVSYTDL